MIRLILLRLLIDRDVKIAFHCPSDVPLSASDLTAFLYSRLTSRYLFFFHNRPPFSTVFTKRKEVNQCDVGFEYSQRNARSRWLPSSDLPPRGSSSVLSVQSFYHLDWHEEKRFDGYSYANQR